MNYKMNYTSKYLRHNNKWTMTVNDGLTDRLTGSLIS